MSANLAGLLLVSSRVVGALALSPLLGGAMIPLFVRGLAAVVLSLALAPLVEPPVMPVEVPELWVLFGCGTELAIGALLGWTASWVVEAVRMAGSFADRELPFVEGSDAWTTFHGALATLAFFVLNGPQWFVSGLLRSFEGWRPGGSFATAPADLLAAGFEVMIKLAAPVILASLLVTFLILLSARFIPGLSPASVEGGLRPLGLIAALLVGVGLIVEVLSREIPRFGSVWSEAWRLN